MQTVLLLGHGRLEFCRSSVENGREGVAALREDSRGMRQHGERALNVGARELAFPILPQLASGRGLCLVPQTLSVGSGAPQVVRAALGQSPVTARRSVSLRGEFADVVERADAVVVQTCQDLIDASLDAGELL